MADDVSSFDAGPLMFNLYKKQLYTDVMFFSSSSKESHFAHRAVMASKSIYFADLLFGNERNSVVGMQMKVEITHIPFSVFTDIVNYCYTGDIRLEDYHTVLEIYAAARVFQISQLIEQCVIYIESMGLTEDNVCSVLQICISKNIDELKDRCLSYIKKNTSDVIRSVDFEKCCFSTVREICNLQNVNLSSEGELLEAVLRWINLQPEHVRKELMKSLNTYIHFLSFSPKQFSNFLQKHPEIMSAEEGLKILIYLNNPTAELFELLPKWCNKTSRTFHTNRKTALEDVMEMSPENCSIKAYLNRTNALQISELTSIVFMRCIHGQYEIKAIKFSFEEISSKSSHPVHLLISVKILPGNFSFNKNYSMKSAENTFHFTKPIALSTHKTLIIEVLAKVRKESFGFLQFERWHCDRKDFEIDFSSNKGSFNFIAEIIYSTH